MCVATFHGFGPFGRTSAHWLRGGRGPHVRAVRGRSISGTKVTALPEWLGQCKLLAFLCVSARRRAAAVRVRGGAGAALRVRCRTGRRAAPRGVVCGGGGVAWLAPAADWRA